MSSLTTKKAIASALKELLNDKPLTKVTINDIADKCAININSSHLQRRHHITCYRRTDF